MLDRKAELTKYIDPSGRGIEVGPMYSPAFPKKEGFDCWVLDFFDAEHLRKMAWTVPGITAEAVDRTEEVDLLGSATEILKLVEAKDAVGTFDYIISCHNFEHLPNPIKFLHGCEKVLKPGGMLSMAIPDRRGCFDYFRPCTTLGDWLSAFHLDSDKPTPSQIFADRYTYAVNRTSAGDSVGFSTDVDPETVIPLEWLRTITKQWNEIRSNPDYDYHDCHCSTFTPASFELLLRDLHHIGLTQFAFVETSGPNNNEFYAHLRNGGGNDISDREFYDRRQSLLHRINDENAVTSKRMFELSRQ